MRLPAVTIAAAFACGIVPGLQPAVVHHASSATFLLLFFILTVLFLFAGILLVKLGGVFPAVAASLLGWTLLGFLGAVIAEQPRATDHITSLIEQQRINLSTPLRWHGHLRDEPAPLP